MMKRSSIIKMLSLLIFVTALGVITSSIAWFIPKTIIDSDTDPIKGVTEGAYFAYGNGVPTDPNNPNDKNRVYGITKPRHLYNLAWLQYLGYFNKKDENNSYHQYYFELADDIDMDGWTLPPIGTEEYPFVGNFEGNGHIISNLTISNNYDDYDKHPHDVKAPNATGTNIIKFDPPHILGFFGVVGNLDNAFPTGSYTSAVNEFKNTGLNEITITSNVSDCLIGLAGGYVDAAVSNIAVQSGKLDVGNNIATPYRATGNNKITSNVSDYSIVGYTKNELNVSKIDENLYDLDVSPNNEFFASNAGVENGWGGSINMAELHGRIQSIHGTVNNSNYTYRTTITKNANGETVNTQNSNANKHITHPTDNTGKMRGATVTENYNGSSGTNVFYLTGGKRVATNTMTRSTTTGTGYVIAVGTNYLSITTTNGTTPAITNTTDINKATYWYFSTNPTNAANNNTTTISTYFNNTRYYLRIENSTNTNTTLPLALTTSSQNLTFNVNQNNRKIFRSYSYNNYYYDAYIYFNNTTWTSYSVRGSSRNTHPNAPTNSSNLTFTSGTRSSWIFSSVETTDYTGNQVTYLPLSVTNYSGGDFTAATGKVKNTGYIVGGCEDLTTSSTYPARAGDIRVSSYPKSGNLTNINDVYTIDADREQHLLTNADKLALDRFSATYSQFTSKVYNYNANNIFGLHFMNAKISTSHIVTADWAYMNQYDNDALNTHTNFQLPASCIDFSLLGAGYIKFFAGSYFTNNNSFFSLHQIERDSNSNITSIKKIDTIYAYKEHPTYSYIYKLIDENGNESYTQGYQFITNEQGDRVKEDLSYQGNYPSYYEPVFYSYQIENKKANNDQNALTSGRLFYFQIPVNAGEYALGSVDGGTGAYLLYLDIGANSARTQRTIITEHFDKIQSDYKHPEGIALIPTTTITGQTITFDDINSACVRIIQGYSGELSIERNDDNVIIGRNSGYENKAIPNYVSEAIGTIKNQSGGDISNDVKAENEVTTITQRMQYYDYDVNTEATTVTTITDTSVNNSSTWNRDIKQYDLATGKEIDEIFIFKTGTGEVFTDTSRQNLPIEQSLISNSPILKLHYILDNQTVEEIINLIMGVDDDNENGVYYEFVKYDIVYNASSGTITLKYSNYNTSIVITIENATLSGTSGTVTA